MPLTGPYLAINRAFAINHAFLIARTEAELRGEGNIAEERVMVDVAGEVLASADLASFRASPGSCSRRTCLARRRRQPGGQRRRRRWIAVDVLEAGRYARITVAAERSPARIRLAQARLRAFPRKIDADAWFDNWAAPKYQITEQSFRIHGEGVITILNLDPSMIR
jgi:hypothetical protein